MHDKVTKTETVCLLTKKMVPSTDPVAVEQLMEAVRNAQTEDEPETPTTAEPSVIIFSGGTAMNYLCRGFQQMSEDISYVMPITDNGGSTSEIIRVLGGPAIGDIRSRLVRLADDSTQESKAVAELLQYRLPQTSDDMANKMEWQQLLEGSHRLWAGISEHYRETIRAFLVNFNTQILTRASREFNFANGSIGNFFFTGARLFFGSLEAAIFLFSGIARIPPKTEVIPIVNLNFEGNTIGAVLANDEVIRGQNQISHPSESSSNLASASSSSLMWNSNSNLIFDKNSGEDLPAPIEKIFYINRDGHEIQPVLNRRVLDTLRRKRTIVYSCGSLYTSIIPTLVVNFVGTAIAMKKSCPKILLLNGYPDRETAGMKASDFVWAITKALNSSRKGPVAEPEPLPPKAFVTHVVYVQTCTVAVDHAQLIEWGIELHAVAPDTTAARDPKRPIFDEKDLMRVIRTIAR